MQVLQFVGPFGVLVTVVLYLMVKDKPNSAVTASSQHQIEFEHLILERIRNLEQENLELRARVSLLELENHTLLHNIAMLENTHQELPLPIWLKDTDGTLLAINRACEDTFFRPVGIAAKDVIGKKDYDFWKEGLVDSFKKYDELAIKRKAPINVIQAIQMKGGRIENWRIIKYPRMVGGTVVGVTGIAIPEEKNGQKVTYEE